ncbi:hypothetical protein O53_297 [Microcystis aeruginosa TAIHU98]|uniref:Uncharacterized protein n=2 Tax=Microcystis aeruginosa TaxID=1126 RepID=L7E9K2_MICAE|nr:hypothetical protein BH695_1592 [Microcystis aeruginosa PCC 7806SL]ELP55699.1 hypothetical protein O53_297 [Microcystis aeruginosa TAIHU98]ELS44688.1 hypothetical protein C789_5512 [Microcystis aeruginosa FACHB-905 = DIANCHI905]ELS44695.1 hypothetical protein C789_5519 [Microcystis aeruginosa FACHB-905 = DIANCHI905]
MRNILNKIGLIHDNPTQKLLWQNFAPDTLSTPLRLLS